MHSTFSPVMNSPALPQNSCLISVPSYLPTAAKSQYLSLASRPSKLHLSCSPLSSPLSFRRVQPKPHLRSLISAIASQQEEDNAILLDEQDPDEDEDFIEAFNSEGEGEEDGILEASGDAGESDDMFGEDAGGCAEPPEDAKLFVGNLPFAVDHESLARIFQQAGTVEIAEVVYNRDTEQSRGFGFVTMSTIEEADKAVQLFNRYELNGRPLIVNKAAPRGTRPERPFEPFYKVYVGNIPWSMDESGLEQMFSSHGRVISARVIRDRDNGRSRGFGFVTLSSEAEMNDAIANLDGKNLEGRAIRVNVAEERQRRSY
ncbi:unnamed protein product [Cuscuta epithymum]|uniref:RRM domain-containing protein n=1 Tax=Cuscuta epithymum TaxID=186058 RepID=A0AAV0DW31_9ASTE|nr:unnamed protein product [Cuscuta epithymum]CAH9146087.1 unnamed protein product [Cuscuta epithymum]